MNNLKEMMRRRILTPNNATFSFIEYLKELDIKVEIEKGGKKYAIIKEKKYDITITAYDSKYIVCRQYNSKGIISLHEKTGQIYILNDKELIVESITREMSKVSYRNATSIETIENLIPTEKLRQLDVTKYKREFMDVADLVGKNILANTYLKLK